MQKNSPNRLKQKRLNSPADYVYNGSFLLESGKSLPILKIRYQTFGNYSNNQVILVCHHLTGDCNVTNSSNSKEIGWWQDLIGETHLLNTKKYFIICANVLGSCFGTTGPNSINPETGSRYNMNFPIITIRDMVNAQYKLLEHLEVTQLQAVIGPSMGGMLALEWAIMYPEFANKTVVLAAPPIQPPHAIGLNEISRLAIMNDPEWLNGNYTKQPKNGAKLSRYPLLLACKNYERQFFYPELSSITLPNKISHKAFEIQKFLERQSSLHINTMDANSYLYLLNAINLHNITRDRDSLEKVLESLTSEMIFIGISSDKLYPPETLKHLSKKIRRSKYFEINSSSGHDAVLTEQIKIGNILKPFFP
ncbi:MAG: homoserine O-acetyltransferase [Gammaproteobacteria bacterium]